MKKKLIILVFAILIIICGILIGMKVVQKDDNSEGTEQNSSGLFSSSSNKEEKNENKNEIKIYSGNDRSIAVVIDNVGDAIPQTGLNDAAIVYEIIVEGGLTRFLAIFKGVNIDTIGPVRSARPYFLDYAMENDSIFTHFGYSARAENDIGKLKINNVNGLIDNNAFWRTDKKTAPHNALTSTEKILKQAKTYGYRTTTNEKSVLNYVTKEVELTEGTTANTITIPYSSSNKVSFKYDKETGRYTRYVNNSVRKDWLTQKELTTKNIIITYANNYTTDEEPTAGRQELENIGNLDGYYITNGKAIKIKCSKSSRNAKTVYKDLNGKEIEVNDGNTYIQIVPPSKTITIE